MIMDSHWFNQATKMMNDCDLINARNKIDLTLKLGLPSCAENFQPPPHHIGQHLDFDQIMTPLHDNLEGIKRSKMVMNEGLDMSSIWKSFIANDIPWTPSKFGSQFTNSQYGFNPFSSSSNNPYHHPFSSSSNNPYRHPFSSSSNNPYRHPHSNNFFNMKPNNNNLLGVSPAMKDYTLLDVPSRRADRELGIGGSSRRTTGMRKQRGGGFIDPFKRCTNYNCNTNDTPMWRKGPLGPKTLCNACGIKYRKDEEKRKAKEAGRSNSQDSNPQIA